MSFVLTFDGLKLAKPKANGSKRHLDIDRDANELWSGLNSADFAH